MIATTESILKISEALAAAQGEFGELHRNKTVKIQTKAGGNFSFAYADLSAILECSRKALASHGLALVQDVERQEGGVVITTRLIHSSGEWIQTGPLVLACQDGDAKEVGIASTYGRRYALQSLLSLAADEDVDAPAPSTSKPSLNMGLCPEHGQPFYLVAAGVSKTSGKSYPAFWACPERGCKAKPTTGESPLPADPNEERTGLLQRMNNVKKYAKRKGIVFPMCPANDAPLAQLYAWYQTANQAALDHMNGAKGAEDERPMDGAGGDPWAESERQLAE